MGEYYVEIKGEMPFKLGRKFSRFVTSVWEMTVRTEISNRKD